MCEARSDMENHISWKIGRGEIDFWFDNWSSLGPLYLLQPDIEGNILIKLNTVYNNSVWNWNSIQGDLSEDVKNKITSLGVSRDNNVDDTTIWRESNNGLFTFHSAWNIIRNKRSSNIATSKIWNCAIPFKMCFLTWRAIYNRLSTDDQVEKLGINIEPGCYCCVNIPEQLTGNCRSSFLQREPRKKYLAKYCEFFGCETDLEFS
ncbi:uncharacterized protein [Solanum tuberosum]|uniref:uncharacterized protein n=1 Tax=Solanum tuberosum TaxID=4113 RepID=UPI00073A0A02|nr:PREDICTED: uncharacterized protein LOC107062891 [Solanum tuberosum]